ncbi:MAG: NTP transferase domain-containing protein [Bacteroidetes bacterium]|nr:NTP transferase domain-containing protein [Bacteroidota bacterium]
MEETYGVVILAGGKSERMNFPKVFLDFNGETFLQKITETYFNADIKNICVVINKEYSEGEWKKQIESVKPFVSEIVKTDSNFGRFHSLKLGINKMLSCDFVFIQNADNPFVDKEIIERLMKNRYSLGYTQLFYQARKGHPVLISKKIIRLISATQGSEHNLRDILAEFPKIDVEVNDKRVLANINMKEDYEKYIFAQA